MIYLTALLVLICGTILQATGLVDAICQLCAKIARCESCFAFWSILIIIYIESSDLKISILCATCGSVASKWLVITSNLLANKYNEIANRSADRTAKNGRKNKNKVDKV